jgi:hypothetical protein
MRQQISDRMYAVAVRDGGLWLVLRIHRNPKGEVFVMPPRDDSGWNPHASYHRDGRHHQKSFDYSAVLRYRPKPDEHFRGSENVMTTGIAASEPRAITRPCLAEDFDGVFEIPIGAVGTDRYSTYVAVNLTEANGKPIITPGAKVIQESVFPDALPWIVVTLFATEKSVVADDDTAGATSPGTGEVPEVPPLFKQGENGNRGRTHS